MKPSFWLEKWAAAQTGFHMDQPHPDLVAQADAVFAGGPHRVLIPLCGKSHDLAWLAGRGHTVVGVELARTAVEQFLAEHQRQAHVHEEEGRLRFESGNVTVHCTDVLTLAPADVGSFDRIWDRAAMVALDPARREAYVRVLRALLRPGGRILLNAFTYDQSQMAGPPHSVPEDEIRERYAGWTVEVLRRGETITEGKFRDRGVTAWREDLYCITKPA